MPATIKIIRKRLKAVAIGVISGIVVCELVLQIYNPVPSAVKSGKLFT